MDTQHNIRLITIGEEIHGDNNRHAAEITARLKQNGTLMINLMASPGAGKTSLIMQTCAHLGRMKPDLGISVVEADIDSLVDAERLTDAGIHAVQMHTGGLCHVDAWMMGKTLEELPSPLPGLLFLENVGNLICPVQTDTGAQIRAVILSIPEGDDKPLKYPLIFRESHVVIINKIDYLGIAEFDRNAFISHVRKLNPEVPIFEVSCKTGEGIAGWCEWISDRIEDVHRSF